MDVMTSAVNQFLATFPMFLGGFVLIMILSMILASAYIFICQPYNDEL